MGNSKNTSRRKFIKLATATSLVAGATPTVLGSAKTHTISPRSQQDRPVSANDKIQIATIGVGGMGFGDTNTALRVPGVELVAVADLYDGRLQRAKEVWGNQIFTTRDYREILARPEVDAVIIATPDHWHMQASIDAMNAGKDVYCEKPVVQSITEGQPVIEAERKTKRIFQVGSQRVSSIVNQKAKELLAAGAIGELNMIEAYINRRSPNAAWQYTIPPDASPQTVDWERFLNKTPKRAFDPVRFFRWRNYKDYGTGIPGDLFVHLFSGIHHIVNSTGPTRVMATGGLRFWNDGRDVPDMMVGAYDYPKTSAHPAFNLVLKVNFAAGGVDPGQFESSAFQFIGSEGVMTIGNGVTVSRRAHSKEPGLDVGTFPKAMQEQIIKEYREKYPQGQRQQVSGTTDETYTAPRGYDDRLDHFTNFFNSVRSRGASIEDASFGFRAAGPALLSNLSYFEKQAYQWNPETMKAKGECNGNGS